MEPHNLIMGKPVRNGATLSNHGKVKPEMEPHNLIMEKSARNGATLSNHGQFNQKRSYTLSS